MRLAAAGFACLWVGAIALTAGQAALNPKSRLALSLDGKWSAIVDPFDTGYYDYRWVPYDQAAKPAGGFFQDRTPASKSDLVEYSFDKAPTLTVPKDWNSQDPKLFLYEGSVWYRKTFDFTPKEGSRVFLHVGAANYEAEVYLNAKKIGAHIGGFTPFDIEITDAVKPAGNSLVIRVNNKRLPEGVPTVNADWWNYGGLTRDVYLYTTPKAYLSRYTVRLEPKDPSKIEVMADVDGGAAGQAVNFSIPELGLKASAQTDARGHAATEVAVPAALQRWSPDSPKLYQVALDSGEDHLSEKIGFRTIEVRGTDILLNGKPVFLRGICLHEENPIRGGRAYSREDAQMLLGWAKQLNCNFIRCAHYPHNENVAEVADELGIMLWEEVPVYWTIQWNNPDTLANAQAQLNDLITRDHNRASVVVWSVGNETPVSEPRTAFLKKLIDEARSLDGSRLVSAAMEVKIDPNDPYGRIVDDPLGAYTDLLSFNEYVGWYVGTWQDIPKLKWDLKYSKPVYISEVGADAVQGLHGDNMTRFTEEYQAEFFRQTIPMLRKIPQLRGMSPWILVDFRSPKRLLTNVQDGWNRKGLIGENGVKKEAFGILADFYAQLRDQGFETQ